MQCARDADPYTVVALEHDSFYDFKKLAKSTLRNVKLDIKNRRVNWLKIKWIRVTKADTDTIYFKYRMKEEFSQIRIKGSSGRRGRPVSTSLSQVYTSHLPISDAKKADLTDLCRSGVIPRHHHDFYARIPSSSSVRDCLAEADITEEPNDTDTEQDNIRQLNRAAQVTIFRLSTGHFQLLSHLHRLKIFHSDECPCGTGPQTPNHILQSCPTFNDLRRQTWPGPVEAHRKLWGPAETLRQTADFALLTGLKIQHGQERRRRRRRGKY